MNKQLTFDTRPEGWEPHIHLEAIPDWTKHPLWPRERTTDMNYLRAVFLSRIDDENMGRMIRNGRRLAGGCPYCDSGRYLGHDCRSWGKK